jgi:ectoine hydroxylase-related dioxygenase (phytanoyl-CoA dioxygenase family)
MQKTRQLKGSGSPRAAAFALMGMINWIYQWFQPEGAAGRRLGAAVHGDFLCGSGGARMALSDLEEQGFQIIPDVFGAAEMEQLLQEFPDDRNGRAGKRHALGDPHILKLANDSRLMEIARGVLGASTFPFRATFFAKTPATNWLVSWHQDKALPIRERRKVSGWGPWSVKEGIHYAHAPAGALEQVLALRIHLDDCTPANGPLRVVPRSHKMGVLRDDEVTAVVRQSSAVNCLLPRGGVLAMRPLLLHSSSKARVQIPRRVLHIEYAATSSLEDELELAVV